MAHDSQTPAPLIMQHLPSNPTGTALDFACGYGRNAFYLASKGYAVDGFDRDETAVAFCNDKAKKEGLHFNAYCNDLEKETPFLNSHYDLLTCFYYLDRQAIAPMKKSLKTGGIIMYETFLIDQHLEFQKPSRSSFCWQHNELLKSFDDFRILYYFEGMVTSKGSLAKTEAERQEGTWVAQLIAQRLL